MEIKENTLSWNAVDCDDHCYYRVFASTEKNFIPSLENQIASTVAEEIPIENADLYYKVLSVDNSGNV